MNNHLNKWFSNKWSLPIGIFCMLLIFIIVAFIFPGAKPVANIVGEIAAAVIVVLALVVFIFRLLRNRN